MLIENLSWSQKVIFYNRKSCHGFQRFQRFQKFSPRGNQTFLVTLFLAGILVIFPIGINKAASIPRDKNYRDVVEKASLLSSDIKIQKMVQKLGLSLVNVMWEDTGRAQNSALGPNISDVTIQSHVEYMDSEDNKKVTISPVAMPVIRYPNFSDKTADLSPNDFYLMVGNEKGQELRPITLAEYLENFREYLSFPDKWKGNETSLLSYRDHHVLVSAQSTLLPIMKKGQASFNPVIFNYQSYEKNPAVLSIIATREGTSATIIDNHRDKFRDGIGQRLFYNKNGEKASFTAMRKSDYKSSDQNSSVIIKGDKTSAGKDKEGLNLVLLIQVPLEFKELPRSLPGPGGGLMMFEAKSMALNKMDLSLEEAVIGHGPVEGPFVEVDGLEIKRDHRFPVRVTVQFYKATSGHALTQGDLINAKKEIDHVYAQGDYVGSLVLDGKVGRPTEHEVEFSLPDWWGPCWKKNAEQISYNQKTAEIELQKYYGKKWSRFIKGPEQLEKALALIKEENKTKTPAKNSPKVQTGIKVK